MIKVNDKIIKIEHYPDGTPRINLDPSAIEKTKYEKSFYILIEWFYENDAELFYLLLVKKHLERFFIDVNYCLYIPYVPNARMDRVKNNYEVFTLKYFAEFINSLEFSTIYTLDAHSNVSIALINNCEDENPEKFIQNVIDELPENIILFFPDAGAAKRYSELFPEFQYCYGEKKRDWKTGKILGLDIITNGIDLKGKPILMVDDIISFGGSLYFSTLELMDRKVGEIYAYATHTENSILNDEKGKLIKLLENNTVKRLYTTNSLFTGQHEKITVMEV